MNVDYQNAQGDTSTINTICQQFVGNKVDAIVAIATPAAQGAATAVAGTDIPVIFSAVTDPAAAGLVENLEAPEGNITGTSDAIPVEKIFELAAELTPDAESFGLISVSYTHLDVYKRQLCRCFISSNISIANLPPILFLYSQLLSGNFFEIFMASCKVETSCSKAVSYTHLRVGKRVNKNKRDQGPAQCGCPGPLGENFHCEQQKNCA